MRREKGLYRKQNQVETMIKVFECNIFVQWITTKL